VTDLRALSVLCGLATWRVASLLHTEDAFEWLRSWMGIENDKDGYPALYPETFWGRLFHCFWCLSLVVALPCCIGILALAEVPWAWALPVWLASSTVAIWTEKQILRAQSR
jgi:hypothetical protein